MDGNFEHSPITEINDNFSDTMRNAIKFLGGRKQWVGSVHGLGGLLKRQFEITSLGTVNNGILAFDETLTFNLSLIHI